MAQSRSINNDNLRQAFAKGIAPLAPLPLIFSASSPLARFGKSTCDAQEFAAGKPIRLIDGTQLLALLQSVQAEQEDTTGLIVGKSFSEKQLAVKISPSRIANPRHLVL